MLYQPSPTSEKSMAWLAAMAARQNPDSDWNRWILSQVPGHLERALRTLTPTGQELEIGRGALEVLPRPVDLTQPIYQPLCAALPERFARLPFLPCTDGRLHAPDEVVRASQEVTELLVAGALDGASGEGLLDRSFLPLRRDRGVDDRRRRRLGSLSDLFAGSG